MKSRHILFSAAIPAIVCCVLFFRLTGYDFIPSWDDHLYITGNDSIKGLNLANIKTAFTSLYGGNYAPVHIISHMLDYEIGGLTPTVYHLTNLLLHAANGSLLFLLLIRLGTSHTAALVAAMIFILHPVQVETVAWVSQRKNLLSLFFMLISFYCYIDYLSTVSGKRRLLYAASLGAAILAMLSKSVAVVIPAVFILYDICSAERMVKGEKIRFASILYTKIPFLITALAVAILTIVGQKNEYGGGRLPFEVSPHVIALSMPGVLVKYAELLLFPRNSILCNIYAPQLHDSLNFQVILAVLPIIFAVIAGTYLYRSNRNIFFWYGLACLSFLPASQIIPLVTLMNDRYLYFPMAGIAPFAVLTLTTMVARTRWEKIVTGALVISCFLLAAISWERTEVWKNETALWSDALAKNHDDHMVLTILGNILIRGEQREQGRALLQKALLKKPDYPQLLETLGEYFLEEGNIPAAKHYFRRFIAVNQKNVAIFEKLGIIYKHDGDLTEAEQAFHRAMALDPGLTHSPLHLSNIYLLRKNFNEARKFLDISIKNGLGTVEASFESACLEAQAGNIDLAFSHLENAVRMGLNSSEILNNDPFLEPLRRHPRQFEFIIRNLHGK